MLPWLMKLRLATPRPVRKFMRIARAVFHEEPFSPMLTQELVSSCRFVAERHDLLDVLPKDGVVAELGVLHGRFSKEILSRNTPRELHLFDLDFEKTDASVKDDPRVVLHAGALPASLSSLPPESCDWIYVDANHSYDGVARDAEAAASRLKPGGFLVFNDFAIIDPYFGQYGVHRAVCEFALKHQWRFVWFAFHNAGLYDVALEKPPV